MIDPSAGQDDPELDPRDPLVILRLRPATVGQIWRDTGERHRTICAIVEALVGTDAVLLQEAIQRIDDAVVTGLLALGLPRGPIHGVEIERSTVMWAASSRLGDRWTITSQPGRRSPT